MLSFNSAVIKRNYIYRSSRDNNVKITNERGELIYDNSFVQCTLNLHGHPMLQAHSMYSCHTISQSIPMSDTPSFLETVTNMCSQVDVLFEMQR